MEKTALVIGATGGFGGWAARKLVEKGWKVKAMHRSPETVQPSLLKGLNIQWVKGDAMHAKEVDAAAKGVSVIIHGANPPGYKNWRGLAIPMLKNTLSAAAKNKARIVFPGNVYNFGPETFPEISEEAPMKPRSKKGQVRVEMEEMLKRATTQGAKVLIFRAGDYFGPGGDSTWMQTVLVQPGKPIKKISYPGDYSIAHAWAYLPDLAETLSLLLEKETELKPFSVFHFRGHVLKNAHQLAEGFSRAVKKEIPLKKFPWALVWMLAPFLTLFRELLEMRYLWKEPVWLNNHKLIAFLGAEPHTPLENALYTSLESLGSLPGNVKQEPGTKPVGAAVL